MTIPMFEIFNDGTLKGLPCGYRHVFAIEGRKWVTLLNWATLETAKVKKSDWERMKPKPHEYKPRQILAFIKRRLKYREKTNLVKQVMKELAT